MPYLPPRRTASQARMEAVRRAGEESFGPWAPRRWRDVVQQPREPADPLARVWLGPDLASLLQGA